MQMKRLSLDEVLAGYDVDRSDAEQVLAEALDARPTPGTASFNDQERALLAEGGVDIDTPADETGQVVRRRAQSTAGLLERTISLDEAAVRLEVDRTRISHRVRDQAMVGVRVGRETRIPLWQITDDGDLLPNLRTVLAAVPADMHPVELEGFMTTPQPELEVAGEPVTPVRWLAGGGPTGPITELLADLDSW